MKPLSLNLSKMRKISGDKHSSTFEHEDGHHIKVLHKALPALQRKQLEKLPVHLADGGPSDDGITGDTITGNTGAPSLPDSSSLPPMAGPNDVGAQVGRFNALPPHPESEAPEQADAPVASQGAPVQQRQPSGNQVQLPMPPDLSGAVGQGHQAINEQQAVDSKKAQGDAEVLKKDVEAKQNLQMGLAQNTEDFQNAQKQFMQDYANGQIDPNHYMENRSTGQKVSNAIGMFLGGLGQGLIGGNNPAADWLNKQIDRDISAQQANLDKKKTLLGANQALFHDQLLASNATRMNMNDIYDHNIQLEAAKLGTAQAKAAADMAHSKFTLENAGLLQQNAMRATALHAAQQGGTSGLADPSILVNTLVPQHQQQKVFDEIEAAQNTNRSAPKILKAFDDAVAHMKASDFSPGQHMTDVAALHTLLGPTFKDVEGTVRQAAMDNVFENITPTFKTKMFGNVDTQRAALVDYLNSKASAPTAAGNGINLQNYPSTRAPQQPKQQFTVGQQVQVKGRGLMQVVDQQGNLAPVKK